MTDTATEAGTDAGTGAGPSALTGFIRDVPDFPTPGVVFKDIGPLLRDPAAYAGAIGELAAAARSAVPDGIADGTGDGEPGFDLVVGIEARGFLFGAPLAVHTGTGFVPVRKAGKLPGATVTTSYSLEYGQATIEMQDDAIRPGDRVLVVDDVLATGGTVAASLELVGRCGGTVVGVLVLIELGFLHGAGALRAAGYTGPLVSLQKV